MATKLKCNRFEITATKGTRLKNAFQWSKMRGKNTIGFGIGYDTFQSALKAVRSENKQRLKPLPVYHRGELVS
jgi:hypothetical protein